ncbi:MAG: hypothetical protein KDD47_16280 [Acidobacteria bacterium]|nr:hypothetical protein [Acidobacteriota bacterium]
MPYAILQTHDRRYLSLTAGLDLPERDSPFEAPEVGDLAIELRVEKVDQPTAFLLEERGGDRLVLREAGTGSYLTAEGGGGGLLLAKDEEEAFQTFTRVCRSKDSERFALLAPDGKHYVSARADGSVEVSATEIGPAEEFLAVDVPPLGGVAPGDGHRHAGCCGPVPATFEGGHDCEEPGVLWDDESHQGLLHRAIALLAGFRTPDVAQFLDIWRSFPPSDGHRPGAPRSDRFKFAAGQVFQGLYEADHVERYIDRWNPADEPHPFSYRTHFYDPKARTNYLTKGNPLIVAIKAGLLFHGKDRHSLEHMTALTEGQRYFNQAVHHGRRIVRFGSARTREDLREAAYYLGLCLHFLTDLTQSMHADNYTAVDLWPERGWGVNFHGSFESFMDQRPPGRPWNESIGAKYIGRASADSKDLTYWQDANHTSIGVVLHQLAATSQAQMRRFPMRFPIPLDEDYVQPNISRTLQDAPRWIVRLLMAWMHGSNRELGLSDKVWYRITERTKGQDLVEHEHSGTPYLARGERGGIDEDKRLFFVIFNPDGTCSFGLKRDPSKLWRLSENQTGWSFQLQTEAAGKPETSFRAVPGLYDRLWLYQGDKEECVTIWDGGIWDGYACRHIPLHGLDQGVAGYEKTGQVFSFEKVRDLNAAEKNAIQSAHPTWGRYTWWGAPREEE